MKKGEFDLAGKAIYCRELLDMGDAGKEIFRALKVACNGVDSQYYFEAVSLYPYMALIPTAKTVSGCMSPINRKVISFSDVLGQTAIDAAIDGATIVFDGELIPASDTLVYWDDGSCTDHSARPNNIIIAYKRTGEKQASIESKILAEKVGAKHDHYFKDVSDLDEVDVYRVCDLFEVNDASGAKQHAIKKLLCSGKRGAKDERKDLEEARDTINRKLAMMAEDGE